MSGSHVYSPKYCYASREITRMPRMFARKEIVAIFFTISVGLFGFTMQYFMPCSNGFARSGSLIVCIGIVFGLSQLRTILGQLHLDSINRMEKARLENDIVFSDSEIENLARGTTDQRTNAATVSYVSRDRSIEFIDITILVVGTLIWGFGDLIFNLCANNYHG